MPSDRKISVALAVLLLVSAVMRGFIAGFIELGNDEVYYWTYAAFPALSHFDHPPMVGLVIQLFSLNLLLPGEFFIRLAAVVCGTFSTWLIYLVGKSVKDRLTGFYAALLYTASFYGFVLSGTFILPDAPQVVFWLLTLWCMTEALPDRERTRRSRNLVLLGGLSAGLALLSKYHSVFLPIGAALYILVYNRRWLKAWQTWAALLIMLLLTLPVVLWNADNGFISFSFHEGRVSITEAGLQPKYFFTEMAGEFFYNNPVNVILILVSLVAVVLGKPFIGRDPLRIILLASLPLILVFQSFSLFRATLPHWTGPGYLGLLLVAAAWLSEPRGNRARRLVPWPAGVAMTFLLLVAGLAVSQINLGWVPLSRWKMKDITHDLSGWRQLGEKFPPLARRYEQAGAMKPGAPILTFRWFPAANIDFYAGTPSGYPVYALGTLERIHKYAWINHERGPLARGSNAWYLAPGDDYEDPVNLYGALYDSISPPDTLILTRRHDTVRQLYVYRLIGLKKTMNFSANPAAEAR